MTYQEQLNLSYAETELLDAADCQRVMLTEAFWLENNTIVMKATQCSVLKSHQWMFNP